jgi:hypothetical protein
MEQCGSPGSARCAGWPLQAGLGVRRIVSAFVSAALSVGPTAPHTAAPSVFGKMTVTYRKSARGTRRPCPSACSFRFLRSFFRSLLPFFRDDVKEWAVCNMPPRQIFAPGVSCQKKKKLQYMLDARPVSYPCACDIPILNLTSPTSSRKPPEPNTSADVCIWYTVNSWVPIGAMRNGPFSIASLQNVLGPRSLAGAREEKKQAVHERKENFWVLPFRLPV